MTREEIITLARDAGFSIFDNEEVWGCCDSFITEGLERFAALVAAHEREACADIAYQWDKDHPTTNYGGCIARQIRARGEV